MSSCFRAGQHLFIRLPSENFKIVQLDEHSLINLGKFGSFQADDIIGHPEGFTYEINPDITLTIVDDPDHFDNEDQGLGSEQAMTGDMIRKEGPQELNSAEIEEFKKQGLTGKDIIERVQQGHGAFHLKTEYSKEKYLKRKKQKFLQRFKPEHIGSSELIEIYLDKDPQRILNISVETLALMLNYGNVRPGGNYLVVDETPGILVAAILERLGSSGSITLAHENEHPNLDCMKYLDIPEEEMAERLYCISWLDLLNPSETKDFVEQSAEQLAALKSQQRGQYFRQRERYRKLRWIQQKIKTTGFDGLLVMTRLDLSTLAPRVLPLVAGSRPVVFFSEYKEVLVDLSLRLKSDLRVLAPTIVETRLRRFQTLPGRIHPLMTSRGHGGHLLWGIRVIPTGVNAAGYGQQQRKKPKLAPDEIE